MKKIGDLIKFVPETHVKLENTYLYEYIKKLTLNCNIYLENHYVYDFTYPNGDESKFIIYSDIFRELESIRKNI